MDHFGKSSEANCNGDSFLGKPIKLSLQLDLKTTTGLRRNVWLSLFCNIFYKWFFGNFWQLGKELYLRMATSMKLMLCFIPRPGSRPKEWSPNFASNINQIQANQSTSNLPEIIRKPWIF